MARVTVLMPAYNVEKYIKEAIESMLNQTFSDFILLVLDDCSTDNTAQVVASFDDKRIKYIKHNSNLGLADNLNRGVELADTEYLARMDGDDISVPTCLEKQIQFLDTHPEIGICSVGFKFFGTKSTQILFPEHYEDIKAEQLFGNSIILPMFRRTVFIDNGLRYKTSAFPAEDYRMWSEALKVTPAYNFQEVMFYYRMHPSQISTEKRNAQIEKSNDVRLYMLDWLSPDFSEEDKQYFVDKFVPGELDSVQDLKSMVNFSKLMIKENNKYRQFSSKAIKKRFDKHFSLSVYHFSLRSFFSKGYSLKSFLKLLISGTSTYLNSKLLFKIFVKCVLNKKS